MGIYYYLYFLNEGPSSYFCALKLSLTGYCLEEEAQTHLAMFPLSLSTLNFFYALHNPVLWMHFFSEYTLLLNNLYVTSITRGLSGGKKITKKSIYSLEASF